jgi:hypothetical protein
MFIIELISVNLELIHHLWIPNIFIYNLKTFKGKKKTVHFSYINVGESAGRTEKEFIE